jgi:hypothetical protein
MVDSIQIFPPGLRIADINGVIAPGAILSFYSAGTTTPIAVYSDQTLTTAIGTTVVCDSGGYPATGAGTRTLVYTGKLPYKIICTDALGVTLWTHDTIRGALDTSGFLGGTVSAVMVYPVLPVSTSGTWTGTDLSKVYSGNPTGGSFARTLPLAALAGNGAWLKIKHDGSSGVITLLAQGANGLRATGNVPASSKAVVLSKRGDSAMMVSDGVDWHALYSNIPAETMTFAVEDQRTAPAASPVVNMAYLINGTPTGLFLTLGFAANTIAVFDGNGSYIAFVPTTDCGWSVFDKSSNINYQFQDNAWVKLLPDASQTVIGVQRNATNAEMKLAVLATATATPSNINQNPGVAKAIVQFNGLGTVAITPIFATGTGGASNGAYNVSSITDNAVGDYTVNFTTPFSTANYILVGSVRHFTAGWGGAVFIKPDTAPTTSACRILTHTLNSGGMAVADMTTVMVSFFGEQ